MKRHVATISMVLVLSILFLETSVLGESKEQEKDSTKIEQLLEELSRSKKKKVNFTETKLIRSLDLKLQSSGTYILRPEGQLEKITEFPFWERVLIEKDNVSIWTKDEFHSISLAQLPSLKIIIESIRAVLSGNLKMLREIFKIKLLTQEDRWSLRLTPKEEEFNQLIKTVTFGGAGNDVSTIRIIQFDGDEILISLR